MDNIENCREISSKRFQKNLDLFMNYFEKHEDLMPDKELTAYRQEAEVIIERVEILAKGCDKELELTLKLVKKKEAENEVLRRAVKIGLEALAQAEAKKARKGKINLLEVPKKILAFFSSSMTKK